MPYAAAKRPVLRTGMSPPEWVPDTAAPRCMGCAAAFTVTRRRHHCRGCGGVFCAPCTDARLALPQFRHYTPVRVCARCTGALLPKETQIGDPWEVLRDAKKQMDTSLYMSDFTAVKSKIALAYVAARVNSAGAPKSPPPAGSGAPAQQRGAPPSRASSFCSLLTDDDDPGLRASLLTADDQRPVCTSPVVEPVVGVPDTETPAAAAFRELRSAVKLATEEFVIEAEKAFAAAEGAARRASVFDGAEFRGEWERARAAREANAVVMRRLHRARSLIRDDRGWVELSTFNGIRTLYQADGPIHITRVEGQVSTPMFYIMALLSEVDLYPLWVPTILSFGLTRNTAVLAQPTVNKRVNLIDVKLPWPLAWRDCLFAVDGIVDVEDWAHRQVVLLLDSIDSSPHCDCPGVDSHPNKHVRAELGEGSSIILSPSDATVTHVCALLRLNPHMQLVPDYLLNACMRMFAFIIIEGVRRAGDVIGREEYRRRYLDPHSAFYNMLRHRIRTELPEQAETVPPVGFEHMDAPLPWLNSK